MNKLLYYLLAITLLAACTPHEESDNSDPIIIEDETVQTDSIIEPVYPFDSKFNELALFLSGGKSNDTSIFHAMEEKAYWIDYSSKLDAIWTKTNAKLPVMNDWTTQELSELNSNGGTLFYPFSGPDFLHAEVFFPAYDTIIMIGLEPIGTYPDLVHEEDTTVELYLNGVRKSLHALLGLSFFRTIAMAKDFEGEVDGTLPIFMHFMNKTGYEIMYQEPVMVEANGELTNDLSQKSDSSYIGNRYYFRKNGNVKVLNYFAVNLQNTAYYSRGGLVAKGLGTRSDFVKFLNSANIRATYLKSASYLMHRPSFSIVRDIILNESTYILQDDSGIPVADFNRDIWDLKFYGSYIKPISLFSERHQEDLEQIYVGDSIKTFPLPFGIGYQFRKGASNLMLGTRK